MPNTKEYYNKKAQEYAENQSFKNWSNKAEKQYKSHIDKFLEKLNFDKVLDAGCGPGRDTEYIAQQGYQTTGIDNAEQMIKQAKKQEHQANYQQMNITDLKFEDKTFDGIWCNSTMQFLNMEQMLKALQEFERTLKAGGKLSATFKTGGQHKNPEPKRHKIVEDKAILLLKKAGFQTPKTMTKFKHNGMKNLRIYTQKPMKL